ncbi:MAG: TRAP transporter small permease subunit [Thermodesulfobacteriota bacterium]
MNNKAWKLITNLNAAGASISATGIITMTGLIIADVILRRLFNAPLIFADEIAGYLLVLITLLSVGYTLKENGHIQVLILIQRLSRRRLEALRIFWYAISLVYTACLLFMTGQLTWESYELKAFSPTPSQLPMAPFQLIMPVGFLFLFFQIFGELIQAIYSLRSSETSSSHPGCKQL